MNILRSSFIYLFILLFTVLCFSYLSYAPDTALSQYQHINHYSHIIKQYIHDIIPSYIHDIYNNIYIWMASGDVIPYDTSTPIYLKIII